MVDVQTVHTQANSVVYLNKSRIHVVMLMQPLAPYSNSSNKKCLIYAVNCAVRMFFVPKMETVEPNIYTHTNRIKRNKKEEQSEKDREIGKKRTKKRKRKGEEEQKKRRKRQKKKKKIK